MAKSTNKTSKKLTFTDLINKKTQSESDKITLKEVYSTVLEGNLVFKKIPLFKYLEILNDIDEGTSLIENTQKMIELIYKSCPELHNNELQEAYECVEPYDIVCKILNDNIGEINYLAEEINKMYGIDVNEKAETSIKN